MRPRRHPDPRHPASRAGENKVLSFRATQSVVLRYSGPSSACPWPAGRRGWKQAETATQPGTGQRWGWISGVPAPYPWHRLPVHRPVHLGSHAVRQQRPNALSLGSCAALGHGLGGQVVGEKLNLSWRRELKGRWVTPWHSRPLCGSPAQLLILLPKKYVSDSHHFIKKKKKRDRER